MAVQGFATARTQMSVNVSSEDFGPDSFLDDLHNVLRTSTLEAECLRLEITESAAMERSPRANALLAAIRKLGVRVDIEDFGTGYSSLLALQHLSIDALKIDASFVKTMRSRNGLALIEAVISLAHNVGAAAIAEGVETAEPLRLLVKLGCDVGQEYLFAPPLDADAAGLFVFEGSSAA